MGRFLLGRIFILAPRAVANPNFRGSEFERGASTRIRDNLVGCSLWGPTHVKHLLTFVGHPGRMDDAAIAEQVLDFRSLTRQSLVGGGGGGDNPLRHRGREPGLVSGRKSGSRLAVCGSTMQQPLAPDGEARRHAVATYPGFVQIGENHTT